eukprot:g6999.t1
MSSELSKPWQGSPPTAFKPKKPFMPRLLRSNKPDHVIGLSALQQGRFEFKGLLRVEGRFEGVLRPVEGANIIVARSGTIVGDVEGCHSVMVEGTIVGSVTATVVDLRRHAHIEGNVWCKDLAAATTAVFRNKAAVTPALSSSSSSSQNHRRSSSASSDPGGGEGANGLVRGSRNSSGSSTSKAAAANGAANTSPESSGHRTAASNPPSLFSSAAATVPLPASSGSLSKGAHVAPAVAATADYGQPPRKPDAVAAAVGTAFPVVDGGGVGGVCPFPGHAASNAAAAGKAFSSEASASASAPGVTASTTSLSSSRLLYNSKKGKDGVAPPSSRGGNSCGGAPQESPVGLLPLPKKNANNASPPPETPPPPSSRRGSRASNGSAVSGGGGGLSNGGSAYTNAAMESPPRTHRRAQLGNQTPDPRAMPTAVPVVFDGHEQAGGASGARWSGRRLATGRWAGCPLPEDVQRAMEREQRKAGLDKVAPAVGDGGGEGGGGAASNRKDPWRDCAKDYGVKTPSLTPAFASVAMLLSFDSYTGFEEHLQMEYAAENLWFWKQGMHFRSSAYESAQKRRDEARRIYDAFLSVDAPDQVNISHEDREAVLAALEVRPGAQAIGAGLFDEALIQVENMLALGPFPRFAGTMVKNIEASWKKVVEGYGVEDVGESFYSVLFEIAPPVESLFTRSKRVQGEMLMSMVDSAVRLLNNLEELVPVLIQLGLRHNAYKVRAEHFPVVENALIATLGLVLQNEFTDEVKQSWLAAYKLMANIMISVLDPPPEETTTGEGMVDASSISCSSREESPVTPPREGKGRAGLAGPGAGGDGANGGAALETSSISAVNSNTGSRRGSLRSANGSGAGSIRGMYRRGTISFKNQFSKLVRKESSTALGQPVPSSAAAAEAQSSPSATAATAATTAATSESSSLSSADAAGAGGGETSGSRDDNGGVMDLVAAASLGAATSRTMEQLQAASAAAAAAASAADAVSRGGGSVGGGGEALPSTGPRKPRIAGDKQKAAGKDGGVAAAGGAPWG